MVLAARGKMGKRVCRKRFGGRGAALSVNAIALRRGQRAKPILAASMRCKAVPRDHPVYRVARNAEQLGRTMAVAMGLAQGPYQHTLRGFVDHGVERKEGTVLLRRRLRSIRLGVGKVVELI